ncbi:FAD-dependent monooxygenase [Actinoplanes sp. NBRC 101535]|uniref:FAD-dependent monooxygenase n=1 Tax=Actinoplanes sp. NBRC 101535 TaxID=3032196 RepID=UPI0024A0A32E|nr:FAD-dependent monooxygenase [Actinoplanes sp. NBRC 101535]GLY02944.1 FAD-binding monooxygenase [Actinoplanes sp. NBRC 101535]
MRVLVTGGSIAGPAVAWQLHRAGFTPTLLERAPEPRGAGQNVDIRGAGRDVLRRTGMYERVAAAVTGETGTRFLRPDGSVYASIPVHGRPDGPTAELEILRGELSRLLLEATAGKVEHRYGDRLVHLTQDERGVGVVTETGREERYDMLVIAEGRRSSTRDLVFGAEVTYRDLGEYVAYGTVDRAADDDGWWHWMTATDGRIASLRPDNVGTARAALGFLAPPMGLNRLDTATQLRVLRERFAGVGWKVPRILDGFAARPREFYFERAEQVFVPRWSHGRVAVVGDAAWGGPTGMGTTLALLGAHVLAGELARAPHDPPAALRAYETLLLSYVTKTQRLPPGVPAVALPRTRRGLTMLHGLHRLAATRAFRRLADRAPAPIGLPDYPALD